MVQAAPSVRLRLMCWTPKGRDEGPPLLFVAGWVSAVSGWTDLLRPIVARRTVYYLETREKPSAEVGEALEPETFSIPRIAACRLTSSWSWAPVSAPLLCWRQ